ncbi:hypothetical protein B0I35DRAFT_473015 [Stachybotrys elegans]|uniref:Glycosyltransferase 2 n=1 Tax=Stachybotrys elegans TaxID=80388 RepID=A0A8K0T1A7_9HYPO|nr:hypothetical protein B0I35DRAFT_473015 [Stachybotrys elegans]
MPHQRARGGSWLWRNDEEMAKKDDDLVLPSRQPKHGAQWHAARPPRRSAVARLALYLVVAVTLMAIYKTFASSSEPPMDSRPSRASTGHGAYGGPIRFPELASSVRALSKNAGLAYMSSHILFAAASLQSASILLPMACMMAKEGLNSVHFILVSRSDIPLNQLLQINGIDEECEITMHDARPDKAADSTETRMALASARSLYHMNMFLRPQAVIVDGTASEETYFLSGIRDQMRGTKASLIELPDRPGERLPWITKLDSVSLGAWHSVNIDILIHAPPSGSGGLNRLLRSLARADLSSVTIPHLTIELPPTISKATETLISGFQWPPARLHRLGQPSMLSLRHRIPRQTLTEEESSVRFLESFWPQTPESSHVLVLSPNTEVSHEFFHYLKYIVLQYRHSNQAMMQLTPSTRMMGISFSTPSTLLDTAKPFTPPSSNDEAGSAQGTFFRWQAPSSDATLFMGEKWIELHGYVSQLLEKQQTLAAKPDMLVQKHVSKKYPSWLEHVLQLSRLRGYYTVYPSRETAATILGVHSDLHDAPEEYQREQPPSDASISADSDSFDPGSLIDFVATLAREGGPRQLDNTPLLAWDGQEVELMDFYNYAEQHTKQFRQEVGQCSEEEAGSPIYDPHAKDLFCRATKTST